MTKSSENRGGKRPNSGRKPKDASGKAVTVSFCCSPEQRDRLNADVEDSGKSRSEYICKKLFGGVFMKRFYVLAERVSIDGYPEQFTVGYDNTATDDFDSFMFFDTKEQAEKWIESEQAKEWKDCSFSICETD